MGFKLFRYSQKFITAILFVFFFSFGKPKNANSVVKCLQKMREQRKTKYKSKKYVLCIYSQGLGAI